MQLQVGLSPEDSANHHAVQVSVDSHRRVDNVETSVGEANKASDEECDRMISVDSRDPSTSGRSSEESFLGINKQETRALLSTHERQNRAEGDERDLSKPNEQNGNKEVGTSRLSDITLSFTGETS